MGDYHNIKSTRNRNKKLRESFIPKNSGNIITFKTTPSPGISPTDSNGRFIKGIEAGSTMYFGPIDSTGTFDSSKTIFRYFTGGSPQCSLDSFYGINPPGLPTDKKCGFKKELSPNITTFIKCNSGSTCNLPPSSNFYMYDPSNSNSLIGKYFKDGGNVKCESATFGWVDPVSPSFPNTSGLTCGYEVFTPETIDCGVNGTYVNGKCVCTPGYSGDKCEVAPIDKCLNVNCGNYGSCFMGICTCGYGYTGTKCEIAPSNPVAPLTPNIPVTPPSSDIVIPSYIDPCLNINCGTNQSCSGGVCNCIDGYIGSDCSINKTYLYVFIPVIFMFLLLVGFIVYKVVAK